MHRGIAGRRNFGLLARKEDPSTRRANMFRFSHCLQGVRLRAIARYRSDFGVFCGFFMEQDHLTADQRAPWLHHRRSS